MAANGQDWERLATMLIARRAELGYSGKRRAAFAREHGLSHTRTIDDLENSRRTNYEPATLAQIEHLYGWRPGSVATVLAGGDPVPAADSASVGANPTRSNRLDALVQEIYDEMPADTARNIVRDLRQLEAEREARIRAAEDELAAYRRRKAQQRDEPGETPPGSAAHA